MNSGGGATPPLNFSILPTPPITPTITAIAPDHATAGRRRVHAHRDRHELHPAIPWWIGTARRAPPRSRARRRCKRRFCLRTSPPPEPSKLPCSTLPPTAQLPFPMPFPFTINPAAGAAVKFPQVVSVSVAGGPADGPSEAPAISSGGRYVAFYSQAKNLITPAVSGNIFVRDTCVGAANCSPKTLAVDVAPDGSAPNGKIRQASRHQRRRPICGLRFARDEFAPRQRRGVTRLLGIVRARPLRRRERSFRMHAAHRNYLARRGGRSRQRPQHQPVAQRATAASSLSFPRPRILSRKSLASLPQAYVRDTCAGPTATKACVARTVAVPVDDEDRVAGAQAGRPAISSDGRYVALEMWTAKSAAQNSTSTSQIVLADTCMGIEPPVSCEASARTNFLRAG